MIGETISHYKILEKLGSGGMGVVYRAEDTKLGRNVALKFLPPELTRDEEAKRRFAREARAASALQHNNICTIHEIDETPDGGLFIAIDYYDGETLRDKIRRGPLPVEEALNYAIQTVSGLAKAHDAGVVHRDIKLANIMVTVDGMVKILDFGLAKLAEQPSLTKTGSMLGTPAYMSPEQAIGGTVDGRSDIFSMGVVLFEILSGHKPFRGENDAAILYRIVHESPEPLTSPKSDVPRELSQIIEKALEKDPGRRYQRSAELLSDLKLVYRSVSEERAVQGRLTARRPWYRQLRRSALWTVFIAVAAIAAALLIFYPRDEVPFSERDWIVIAGFDNLTGDPVFDGSLDMPLRIALQQSRYINVFPRARINEVLQRMGRARTDTLDEELAREVALRENMRIVVVPTIDKIADRYLLSARIVDPLPPQDLKIESVETDNRDRVLHALGELAEKIRSGLGESKRAIEKRSVGLPRATTPSIEALKNFTDGSHLWALGRYNEAVTLWHEAVRLDSSFAWAHASLGMYYYWHYKRKEGDFHLDRALSALDKTTEREQLWIRSLIEATKGNREEAIKYIRLYLSRYPNDRDAWFNLGNSYLRTGQYDNAAEAFKKSIEIDPKMSAAYINLATAYHGIGNLEKSIENYEIAYRINPEGITYLTVNHEYGFVYVKNGDLQKAREIFQKMLSESDQKKAMGYRSLGLLDAYLGKYSSAIENFKKTIVFSSTGNFPTDKARNVLYLAAAYRGRGMTNELFEQLGEFEKIHEAKYLPPITLQTAGSLYARADRMADAERLMRDLSSSMDERNLEDRIHFGILKGEIEIAKKDYSAAISTLDVTSQLGESGLTLQPLAYALYKNGNRERAITIYEKLIAMLDIGWESQENWILAHIELAELYEEMGDAAHAAEYYEKLIDLWKEADEDLPLLLQAKKQLSHLKQES